MPKANDKGVKRKRDDTLSKDAVILNFKAENLDSMYSNNDKILKKNKVTKKRNKEENIAKSKQLIEKRKTCTHRQKILSVNCEPRVCGNGKPMPSLAELEKMYEDSDDEGSSASVNIPSGIKTPEQRIPLDDTTSPKTLKEITSKIVEFISHLPDSTVIQESPIVPPKKKKKTDTPYIVGANKRKQYLKKLKSVVGKGDCTYGIKVGEDNEDNILDEKRSNKRKSRIKVRCTSNFNAKTDEITSMLKDAENTETHSDGSVDSNKTLTYDFNAISPTSRYRTFSPIPSTSKDNETFLKNDMRFNESLLSDNSQSEIEVIEIPCETIILDDDDIDNNIVYINDCMQNTHNDIEDSYCSGPKYDDIPPIMDYYSSYNNTYNNDDCETIDVDDVIAENRAIIERYKTNSINENVVHIPPNYDEQSSQQNVNDNIKNHISNYKGININSNNTDIATVVKTFFSTNLSRNIEQPVTMIDNEQYMECANTKENIRDSSEPALFKNLLNYIIECSQTLIKTFNKKSDHPSCDLNNVGNIIDKNNVNMLNNTNYNDESLILVSTTRTERNIPNNDSIILVSTSVLDNSVTSTQSYKTRKRTKKSQAIVDRINSQFNEKTDSPIRSIGDCPICMENLSNNTVASTICGHIFCMKCIQAAIKASGKKCPTCRKTLKGTGYHPLFL